MFLSFLFCVRLRFDFPEEVFTDHYNNRIDHFNSTDDRTFAQRYYANLDNVPSAGFNRALVYIGGEVPLLNRSLAWGSMMELSRRLQAPVFGLEHRFFGQSQPFPEPSLTIENFRFLTIEQSLEDLAQFIDDIVFNPSQRLPDLRVGVIGGSYPGALSSWFRLKYPHLASASWASSAPVWIKNNFSEYDDHVAHQLADQSADCLKYTKGLFNLFQSIVINGGDGLATLRNEYGFTAEQDNTSVLYVLSDILASMVQFNTNVNVLTDFCTNLTGDPQDKDRKAFHAAANRTLAYLNATVQTLDLTMATDEYSTSDFADSRAWSWITCTEVGWFQTSSGNLRPDFVNLSYFRSVCRRLFNLSRLPPEREMNNRYGGLSPRSTKVFYVSAGVDPWTRVSVQVGDESVLRRATVVANESHCADLYPISPDDSAAMADAKQAVISQMQEWLDDWDCNASCGAHGRCVVDGCQCNDGWGGQKCDVETKSKMAFDVAVICGISIPVLLTVILIFGTWLCVYRPRRAINERALLGK
jgi:serine protease 16